MPHPWAQPAISIHLLQMLSSLRSTMWWAKCLSDKLVCPDLSCTLVLTPASTTEALKGRSPSCPSLKPRCLVQWLTDMKYLLNACRFEIVLKWREVPKLDLLCETVNMRGSRLEEIVRPDQLSSHCRPVTQQAGQTLTLFPQGRGALGEGGRTWQGSALINHEATGHSTRAPHISLQH